MYNPTRLEWHLGDELVIKPRRFLCGLVVQHDEPFDQFNRLVVALAKSQDHRASCGVFAFGQPNAERRWLGMRYPVTRANQSRESGLRIELGGSGKSLALCASKPFKSVQCDVMTRLRKATSKAKANPHFDAVRLCFVPTLTKRLHRDNLMRYGLKDNEIASKLRLASKSFLRSKEWKELRRKVINTYGRRCMKCLTTPKNPKMTHVDHIKPRKTHPELALDFDNLQVLCCRCNKEKGNKHSTDYRTYARKENI
jgi:5-methylcytosine-specific restriction endonuclease McrA